MERTYLITGSASGIGRATVERCRADGCRVIGVDLHNAEIEIDLATPQGRARMIEEANRLAPERLDGVVAGAGISSPGRAAEVIAINYFAQLRHWRGYARCLPVASDHEPLRCARRQRCFPSMSP